MKLEKRSHSLEKKSKSPKREHEDTSKRVGDSSTNKPKKAGGMSFFTKAASKDDRYSFLKRFFYDAILQHFLQAERFSSWWNIKYVTYKIACTLVWVILQKVSNFLNFNISYKVLVSLELCIIVLELLIFLVFFIIAMIFCSTKSGYHLARKNSLLLVEPFLNIVINHLNV